MGKQYNKGEKRNAASPTQTQKSRPQEEARPGPAAAASPPSPVLTFRALKGCFSKQLV
jgi:hypothetical protein